MTSLLSSKPYHFDLNESTKAFLFLGFMLMEVLEPKVGKIKQFHLLKQDRANGFQFFFFFFYVRTKETCRKKPE